MENQTHWNSRFVYWWGSKFFKAFNTWFNSLCC